MKLHSLSKVLILPMVLIAILIIYLSSGRHIDSIWVLVPVIFITIFLIFGPQIDYWYKTKYPLPVDREIMQWIERYIPFYNSLSGVEKNKFQDRLGLYLDGREFKSVGSELREVPEDIKGMIASIPIMLTLYDDDFLIGDYDRVYVYKHAFPSPDIPRLHSAEVNHEDGVILMSLEHLIPALTNKKTMYNVGLHAYLEAYCRQRGISVPECDFASIQKVSGFSEEHIHQVLGLENVDPGLAALVIYFSFPTEMASKDLNLYNACKRAMTNNRV